MAQGGASAIPVVDVEVDVLRRQVPPGRLLGDELQDGRVHWVFAEAMAQAGPVLLEPVSLVEVTVPAALQGDVMGDLNCRRGRIQGTEVGRRRRAASCRAGADRRSCCATPSTLRSITGGRGRFTRQHDHYDRLPQNLVAGLARAAGGSE